MIVHPKDFDKLPAEEVGAAALWEYARRSKRICQLAEELRTQIAAKKNYSEAMRAISGLGGPCAGPLSGMIQNAIVGLGRKGFLRDPPWDELPSDLRGRMAGHTHRYTSVIPTGKHGEAIPIVTGPEITHQIVAFSIDWSAGIHRVIEDFAALLNGPHRNSESLCIPPGTPNRERAGRTSSPQSYSKAAFNALIEYNHSKARHSKTGTPRIAGANSRQARNFRIKSAERYFQEMFGFAMDWH